MVKDWYNIKLKIVPILAKISQGPKRTQKQNNQSHIESQKDQNQFEVLRASQTVYSLIILTRCCLDINWLENEKLKQHNKIEFILWLL